MEVAKYKGQMTGDSLLSSFLFNAFGVQPKPGTVRLKPFIRGANLLQRVFARSYEPGATNAAVGQKGKPGQTAFHVGHKVPFQCLALVAGGTQLSKLSNFVPNLNVELGGANSDHSQEEFPERNKNTPEGISQKARCRDAARRLLQACVQAGAC
jgi:hypothetical protein